MARREDTVLQRILHFLQAILQELLPARFAYTEQTTQQAVCEQDMSILHSVSTMNKDLNETGEVPVMALPAREPTTEPCRALMRLKHPAHRYRDLDALLDQIKRDRLKNVETQLIPIPVHELARQLQRHIEQEEGKGRR